MNTAFLNIEHDYIMNTNRLEKRVQTTEVIDINNNFNWFCIFINNHSGFGCLKSQSKEYNKIKRIIKIIKNDNSKKIKLSYYYDNYFHCNEFDVIEKLNLKITLLN